MKIFGYGTFITNKIYRKFQNVRVAFLPGYIRILRHQDFFPYILRSQSIDESIGLWGLIFEIASSQLTELDYYEGGLYDRIETECVYTDGSKERVMTYYPTPQTIQQCKLNDFINKNDLWQEKIITEHPEIIDEFPELGWNHPPRVQ